MLTPAQAVTHGRPHPKPRGVDGFYGHPYISWDQSFSLLTCTKYKNDVWEGVAAQDIISSVSAKSLTWMPKRFEASSLSSRKIGVTPCQITPRSRTQLDGASRVICLEAGTSNGWYGCCQKAEREFGGWARKSKVVQIFGDRETGIRPFILNSHSASPLGMQLFWGHYKSAVFSTMLLRPTT